MKRVSAVSRLVLLALAIMFFASCGRESNDSLPAEYPADYGRTPDVVFSITSESNYRFQKNGHENPDLVVNEGDLVRVEFTNNDSMPHNWVVDEFNAATETINQGGQASVEFVADSRGTFEYYCSVGQHRAMGMYGNLIVE